MTPQNPRRITKHLVDSLRANGREYIVYDAELQGFGVRVKPSGRRVFIAQYRIPGAGRRSHSRRITLGGHGEITAAEARALARKVLGSVHHGSDPARERTAQRQAPLVGDLVPAFLADVDRERKAKTAYEYRRMFGYKRDEKGELVIYEQRRGEILPVLARLRVRDVARPDIVRLKARKEGRYAANRLLALVSAFFSWCEERGYREPGTNPCRGIKRYAEAARRRYLSPDEARALGKALRVVEHEGANRYAVAAIRFLLLTGFREQEALTLQWSSIELPSGSVKLTDAKTTERERTLNDPALALLNELPRVEGNSFVFPGLRQGDHLKEIKRVWDKVREKAQLRDFRLHDLRHSFASAAISRGATLAVVGELLGHRSAQTTKRYAHLHDDARRAASDEASEALAALLNHQEPTPITPLRAVR